MSVFDMVNGRVIVRAKGTIRAGVKLQRMCFPFYS